MVEFEVRHTEEGVRRATRALWDSRYRRSMLTSLAVAVLALLVGLVTSDLPWYLAVVLTVAVLHAAYLWRQRGRVVGLAARERAPGEPAVLRYRLDDGGLAASSAAGSELLPWSSFAALREGPDFVFLLRSPLEEGRFIAFPRAQLPTAALDALRAHVPG